VAVGRLPDQGRVVSTDTFAGRKVRHGTPSGWSTHKDLGERPCDACYRARQAYDKRRKEAPEIRRKDRLKAKAQAIATKRLVHLYPELYQAFYEDAKAQVFETNGGEL
jgi:hypothetical protein